MSDKFKMTGKQLSSAWKDGLANKDKGFTGGFVPEDGRYLVAVTMAERGESKNGRDQIIWEYTFLDGDYKGKTYRSYDGLDKPERVPFVIRRIESLGFKAPEDVDGLEGVLEKITKKRPQARIRVKTNGEFVNVYLDKLMDDEDQVEDAPAEKEEVEDKPTTKKVSKEAPEEDAPSGDVDVQVGMKMRCFNKKGVELGIGEVKKIDEDAGKALVEIDGEEMFFTAEQLKAVPVAKKGLKAKA